MVNNMRITIGLFIIMSAAFCDNMTLAFAVVVIGTLVLNAEKLPEKQPTSEAT